MTRYLVPPLQTVVMSFLQTVVNVKELDYSVFADVIRVLLRIRPRER